MIKLILAFAFVAVASAISPITSPSLSPYYNPRPTPTNAPTYAPTYNQQPLRAEAGAAVLRYENDAAPDGSTYQWAYETENGIGAQETGSLSGSGPEAGRVVTGSYQYTSPEGIPILINYVADENGFQASGDAIPTSPPIPEAILRSIAYNAANPEPQSPVAPPRYRP